MTFIVSKNAPVLLVGAGDVQPEQLKTLAQSCESIVAADGGADHVLGAALMPDAVIGDFDSISPAAKEAIDTTRLFPSDDQNSTDLTKGINAIEAPVIVGLGFFGDRLDHQMAAQTALVRAPDRQVILVGASDMVFLAPPHFALDLPDGDRFSLYPMAQTQACSTGLFWPLNGLLLSPLEQIATSNRATGAVDIHPADPWLLSILSNRYLPEVMDGFLSGRFGAWPPLE